MDPAIPDINISDVVVSTAGRDQGNWFYVVRTDTDYLLLANGKDRTLDKIRSFALRPELQRHRRGNKVLNSELRRDLAFLARQMQDNNLGG